MLSALTFGLAASSALVIGAVAGAYWTPPRLVLASALAFASGALITALAFDLFQESFERGAWLSAIRLLAGAATFVAADELLDRYIEGAGGGVSALHLPLFTGVRRKGLLRSWTSALRSSEKFAYSIGHSPEPNTLGPPVLTPAVFCPLRVSLV